MHLTTIGFPCVILTRGKEPTMIAQLGKELANIPTYETKVIDTAGAGDVFDVAFMVEYLQTNNANSATAFANACASFKVENCSYTYNQVVRRAKQILS